MKTNIKSRYCRERKVSTTSKRGRIVFHAGPLYLISVLVQVFWAQVASATDHTDGEILKERPALDITDFYAFPSGSEDDPKLVMIMTVHPFAPFTSIGRSKLNRQPEAAPSEYRFRIRNVELKSGTPENPEGYIVSGENEVRIVCAFNSDRNNMTVRVEAEKNDEVIELETIIVPVDDEGGAASESGLRASAGIHADPFFTEYFRVRETGHPRDSQKQEFERPSFNLFGYVNVWGIVVEAPVSTIRAGLSEGQDAFLGVVAESWGNHHESSSETEGHDFGRRDRQGRVEITQFLIGQQEATDEFDQKKDKWNAEDPFAVSDAQKSMFRTQLHDGLAYFDRFDGGQKHDWAKASRATETFLEILLNDFLIVDPTKPIAPDSSGNTYLEIELAAMRGEPNRTCGGRAPNDDVIDTSLTLFINGFERSTPLRRDGLHQSRNASTAAFPYLAPPNDLFDVISGIVEVDPDLLHEFPLPQRVREEFKEAQDEMNKLQKRFSGFLDALLD